MATFRQQLTPIWIPTPALVEIQSKQLSGLEWVSCFPTSTDVGDLVEPFRSNVRMFLAALDAAGCSVTIAATLRPKERAYLMHYSSAIISRKIKPEDVPPMDGVLIEWVHPNRDASIAAAATMARGYGIVYPPALKSRHTDGRAIDMRINDAIGKSVTAADGKLVKVTTHENDQSDLFQVGASYNVIKLISDVPHWSDDGK
jgi:hypothetical protein